MSLILKGIDLPKEGKSICVTIWNDGIIYATDENKNQIDTKESEAIQIPKGHGTLIEERYLGELQVRIPAGVFVVYHSAVEDTDRFIFESEAEK